MKPTSQGKYQKLVRMLEAFVASESSSLEFVREMDAEFWASGLNEDDKFSDLIMALDMFGAPAKDFGYDVEMLASEWGCSRSEIQSSRVDRHRSPSRYAPS